MANIPVKNEFKTEMVAFERTDKALADSFNEKYSQLLSNEHYLNSHKVEKVDGKGLSTNDYDNDAVEEVAKISSIEETTDQLKSDLGGCKFSVVDGNLIITYGDGTEE